MEEPTKKAIDLKIGDTIWKDRYSDTPDKCSVTGIKMQHGLLYITIDKYVDLSAVSHQATQHENKIGAGNYFFNLQDALLYQHKCLKELIAKQRKLVVTNLADLDELFERQVDLIYAINEEADKVISWDELSRAINKPNTDEKSND